MRTDLDKRREIFRSVVVFFFVDLVYSACVERLSDPVILRPCPSRSFRSVQFVSRFFFKFT